MFNFLRGYNIYIILFLIQFTTTYSNDKNFQNYNLSYEKGKIDGKKYDNKKFDASVIPYVGLLYSYSNEFLPEHISNEDDGIMYIHGYRKEAKKDSYIKSITCTVIFTTMIMLAINGN